MQASLTELLAFIGYCMRRRMVYEGRWIGQGVRLKVSWGILPERDGGRVLLQAGAVGSIVRLQMDPQTPFILEFPGFPYRVAPLLEKLEFLDGDNTL